MLMARFGDWLFGAARGWPSAFDAHLRLVSIHPFADGNGRAARLLMNLLLIRSGYPPIAVRPEDRQTYIKAVERAQVQEDAEPFNRLLADWLAATLDEYVGLVREAIPR